MRSLVVRETGLPVWEEVGEPRRELEREALVRPLAVGRCDLDRPMILGETPFPLPIHLGHECVGEVIEGPEPVAVGDRVIVPFQISCGTCERCRRGLTGSCETVPPLSMYGFGAVGGAWGGALSDVLLVPYAQAMLVRVPNGIDPVTLVSAADNLADGWRAVAPALAELPAADVLVVGGGRACSIPLYAVDAALALGAASVTYVDTDADRLVVADRLGAKIVEGRPERSLGAFPITVDGTATPDGLLATLGLTDWGGRCTSIAQLEPEAPLPLLELYSRGVHLHIGRAMARPAIPPILDLIAAGRLRPQLVTSATAAWDDAPEAMLESATKLVIARS